MCYFLAPFHSKELFQRCRALCSVLVVYCSCSAPEAGICLRLLGGSTVRYEYERRAVINDNRECRQASSHQWQSRVSERAISRFNRTVARDFTRLAKDLVDYRIALVRHCTGFYGY